MKTYAPVCYQPLKEMSVLATSLAFDAHRIPSAKLCFKEESQSKNGVTVEKRSSHLVVILTD